MAKKKISYNAARDNLDIRDEDDNLDYTLADGNGDINLADRTIKDIDEIRMRSPNGTLYSVTVDNSGNLTTTAL